MKAKVRIVMPIYNYGAYAAKGIESVLRQTEPEWELYIVDDGSSDNTPEICQHYVQKDSRIHFCQQQNSGQYNIVNQYSADTQSKYSAVLDGDDQLAPDYIAKMYRFAEAHQCDVALTAHKSFERKPLYCKDQQVFTGDLALQYLHGTFSLPASGIFVRTSLRQKILPLLPKVPLYAATDDLQGFFLACHAQRIGHSGSMKYWRNFASRGTWRNKNTEFRLRKTYSMLFCLNYIQDTITRWSIERQAETASSYLLRWLRYNLLENFCDLETKEQFHLLQTAIATIHKLQSEIFISPQEQIAYLSDMPYQEKKRPLRHLLRDLLPYGYVSRKKGRAPNSRTQYP